MRKIMIIPESVQKNPNAGETSFVVPGAWECDFEYTGPDFEKYIRGDGLIVTGSEMRNGLLSKIHGFIETSYFAEKFSGIPGFVVKQKFHKEVVHGFPQPQYFFEYEKFSLQCDSCCKEFDYKAIIFRTSDEGWRYTICPNCRAEDSFPELDNLEWQNIKEIVSPD